MALKLSDIASENFYQLVETEQEQIKMFEKSRESMLERQMGLFNEYVNKLSKLIDYIAEYRYKFSHPTIEYVSSRGPILTYDRKEHKLIVLDAKSKKVVSINLHNDDDQVIWVGNLIEQYSFEEIMDGLLCSLEHFDRVKKIYQEDIDKREEAIQKYQNFHFDML